MMMIRVQGQGMRGLRAAEIGSATEIPALGFANVPAVRRGLPPKMGLGKGR